MHQSFLGTRLTGLWWNNSLSFNLIFFVSFLLRLFVCSHDFGCCLSSGGMYTCSSQTLVHLSALRCFLVVRHAFVSSSFFFYTFTQRVFFFFLVISCIFIDSFEPVCLFSLSFSRWFVHTLISVGWKVVAGLVCHPVVLAWGCFVTTLPSSLTLFSLYAVVVTLFDLFFWKLHYPFFPYSRHRKRSSWLSSWPTHLPFDLLLFGVWLHGNGILHLFNIVALLCYL